MTLKALQCGHHPEWVEGSGLETAVYEIGNPLLIYPVCLYNYIVGFNNNRNTLIDLWLIFCSLYFKYCPSV